MQIYLVGGAVRDKYLGLPVKDKDWVVVGARPAELLAQGYKPVGKDFPVFLHPSTKEEYALARTERKAGKGYYGFECDYQPTVTLEEDLRRRDLTINAMAETLTGKLIDPYHGLQDLQQKYLRHVADSFIEDPLRVLRVARLLARFAPLGFSIAEATLGLMQAICRSDELSHLPKERIWQEMQQALQAAAPWHFFQALKECAAWSSIFANTDNIDYSFFTGSLDLESFKRICQGLTDPRLRFAGLFLHSPLSAAPLPLTNPETSHSVKQLGQALKVPNTYTQLAADVSLYQGLYRQPKQGSAQDFLNLLKHFHALQNPHRLLDFISVCKQAVANHDQTDCAEKILLEILNRCKRITPQPFIAQGLTGAALGQALEEADLEQITQVISQSPPSPST